MNEITIITAFFDINRHTMGSFSRTREQYFEYFSDWARLQNRIVVFCSGQDKVVVERIRQQYGLSDKTNIIEVENVTEMDIDLFRKIDEVMNSNHFRNFMYFDKNPEVINSKYNFIMCIKPLLVNVAIEKLNLKGLVAWMDFGFNHNREFYPYPYEFDFNWKYNFDSRYIHLFRLKELPDLPIFEVIRRMETYIQGGVIVADSEKWPIFWGLVRDNMSTILRVGLSDDDQVLYLMAVKAQPDEFEVHLANWNQGIKLFGGENLTYISKKESENRDSRLRQFRIDFFRFYRKILYSIRTLRSLCTGDFNG